MSYKRKYSVFISSTYEDLIEERQELLGVALENDYIPFGMEQFHAYPAKQWDVITKMIDECDAYLLVIGGRYGSIDQNEKISFTEKEYNYAKSKNIPVLVLIRNIDAITQDKIDSGDEKYEKQKKLDEFKKKVMNDNNTVSFFSSLSDLKYEASNALRNAVDFCGEQAGWVRYSDIKDIINSKIQETRLEEIENTISKLKSEFDKIKYKQENDEEIQYITKEELDSFFKLDGTTLHINLPNRDKKS